MTVSRDDSVPSTFFSHLERISELDKSILRFQATVYGKGRPRGFDERIATAVAVRCRHGIAQVTVCTPFYRQKPFPTTFWLSCPHLTRVAGQLESHQSVSKAESFAEGTACDWKEYNKKYAIFRLGLIPSNMKKYMRRYRKPLYRSLCRGGVGGIRYDGRSVFFKCLHLQIASYLALPGHPLKPWFGDNVDEWSCKEGLCRNSVKDVI